MCVLERLCLLVVASLHATSFVVYKGSLSAEIVRVKEELQNSASCESHIFARQCGKSRKQQPL